MHYVGCGSCIELELVLIVVLDGRWHMDIPRQLQ